jgi:hypothetical protein
MNLVKLDIRVLFGTCLEVQVKFCCNSSWFGNYTSQDFQPYMVVLVIHPDGRERCV